MLVAAAVLVVVAVLASLPRVLRVRRRARALSRSLAANRHEVRALFEEQARLRGEAGGLSQPQRRLLRWLRHPLVAALWASNRMRRSGSKARAASAPR
jgi:hypothetical protein